MEEDGLVIVNEENRNDDSTFVTGTVSKHDIEGIQLGSPFKKNTDELLNIL